MITQWPRFMFELNSGRECAYLLDYLRVLTLVSART